eukprot:scpid78344/ scgid29872/ 
MKLLDVAGPLAELLTLTEEVTEPYLAGKFRDALKGACSLLGDANALFIRHRRCVYLSKIHPRLACLANEEFDQPVDKLYGSGLVAKMAAQAALEENAIAAGVRIFPTQCGSKRRHFSA